MSKNKKKHNFQRVKEERAHQKNLYLKKIREMMGILGIANAWDLLNDSEKDFIYQLRLRPVKIINSPDKTEQVKSCTLALMNERLNENLKYQKVELFPGKPPVTLYDFVVYVETIYLHHRNTRETDFKNARTFLKLTDIFTEDYKKFRVKLLQMIDDVVNIISWSFSDILHQNLWAGKEENKEDDKSLFYNNYIIHAVKPESKLFEIDGRKRSIFSLGFGLNRKGIMPICVLADKIGRNGILGKMPLKVYIQAHVMERIKERLGYLFDEKNLFNFVTSFANPEYFEADNGSILIAYKTEKTKYGYLKADIFGDILILRTFLFLTNDGTPEGKKLSEILGIQKEDKKYLGIDKLSIFIESDIEKNEKIKEIFIKAGCGQLFDFKKGLEYDPSFTFQNTEYLLKYLEKGEIKEEV